ncbi:MAG: CidA/LrgA family protein [Clostridia bacterium]|jgi:holin-like protein|nr:CidA/LrgA family protein [Clostridia bacterium]MCI1958106.1 CidA/LrgA family protein [Clostridia bacterium]MCI1999321.1 CidA/LrgA family protein [Clostridia bacterium]MCI2015177.1 CidA/LrgA family protein [Clostridia bacterium]
MKYIKQFMIIFGITFLGEVIYKLLDFPIPAGIYGLVILLLFLQTGILKFDEIKDVGEFLLDILAITFVPSTVGIVTASDDLKQFLIPILLALFVVTFIVFGITGRVSQFFLERKHKL